MRKPTFIEMNSFVALADALSFAKASINLGISTSTLSGTIRTLEERLGVRLINRSNRSVALTEIGERLAQSMRVVIKDYAAALEAMNQNSASPKGNIRIISWPFYARIIFSPLLSGFLEKYPDISFELTGSQLPHTIDLVKDNFDIGTDFVERIGPDMATVRMTGKIRTVILGSPEYFRRHPKPISQCDLEDHNCIRTRLPEGNTLPWRTRKNGKDALFNVDGTLVFNDLGMSLRAACEGLGLCFGTYPLFEPFIKGGELVEVLQDWAWESDGIFLYYPAERPVPAHVQAFIDFAKTHAQVEKVIKRSTHINKQNLHFHIL